MRKTHFFEEKKRNGRPGRQKYTYTRTFHIVLYYANINNYHMSITCLLQKNTLTHYAVTHQILSSENRKIHIK